MAWGSEVSGRGFRHEEVEDAKGRQRYSGSPRGHHAFGGQCRGGRCGPSGIRMPRRRLERPDQRAGVARGDVHVEAEPGVREEPVERVVVGEGGAGDKGERDETPVHDEHDEVGAFIPSALEAARPTPPAPWRCSRPRLLVARLLSRLRRGDRGRRACRRRRGCPAGSPPPERTRHVPAPALQALRAQSSGSRERHPRRGPSRRYGRRAVERRAEAREARREGSTAGVRWPRRGLKPAPGSCVTPFSSCSPFGRYVPRPARAVAAASEASPSPSGDTTRP